MILCLRFLTNYVIIKYILYLTLLFNNSIIASEIRFNHVSYDLDTNISNVKSMVQTKDGLMLFGSYNGLLAYDGYNFTQYFTDKAIASQITSVKSLYLTEKNKLWIGTSGNGLFKHEMASNKSNNIVKYKLESKAIYAIVDDGNRGVWVGTNQGIVHIDLNDNQRSYQIKDIKKDTNFVRSLLLLNKNTLLVGSQNGLYQFNLLTDEFTKIDLKNLDSKKFKIIYSIHQDSFNSIWLGAQNGIYLKNKHDSEFHLMWQDKINLKIQTITSNENYIWFGSVSNGLYVYNRMNKNLNVYTNNSESSSLSDNTIRFLYYGQSNILWLSTFNESIDYIDLNSKNFGFLKTSKSGISCGKNEAYNKIYVDNINNDLWLINHKGVIKISKSVCEYYSVSEKNISFLSVFIDSDRTVWATTTHGLYKFDKNKNKFQFLDLGLEKKHIEYLIKFDTGFLVPTWDGLYKYNTSSKKTAKIETVNFDVEYSNLRLRNYAINQDNTIYFASNLGVLILQDEGLTKYSAITNLIADFEVYSIIFDSNDNMLIGTLKNGIIILDSQRKLLKKLDSSNFLHKGTEIRSLIQDNENFIWAGTNKGLVRVSPQFDEVHIFQKSDGLQDDYFKFYSIDKAIDGRIYFGGIKGINAFYPQDIKINNKPPEIILTNFTRFGKTVEVGNESDGFLLEKHINQLEEITLTHEDYVFGLEFAALDYADPSRNKFSFKLEGQDPDWIHTDANNRKISYSNLKPGDYTFRVKGANKDGTWNTQGKSLRIKVLPAPWLSWWAYLIYCLLFFTALYYFINWRNKENRRINLLLRDEVDKQTKELKLQKQKVEILLAKKNELFANVSHEFRTPLTLILGPINKLLKSQLPYSDINSLKMVNRNANRLLTMVEQLLQLAKTSSQESIKFYPIKLKNHIITIVDSFAHLAKNKNIKLLLNQNDDVAISCSKDALDIILGNLISNAIKYTQQGGEITISSVAQYDSVEIHVNDTGCGLDDEQQKDIFNRFNRLDAHKNIEGVGIGLSVVEDLLRINKGQIHIKSKPGIGSCFIVSFKTIANDFDETNEIKPNLLVTQLANEDTKERQQSSTTPKNLKTTSNKPSVLVIDDNDDMRAHLSEELSEHYDLLLADRGKKGVALAIEYVPDIIICDVMMPEMDGFQVSRLLRTDTRTSHIPLLLLTALNDKKSRIRGWREHVDVYLTKPFDAQELLLQLENILVIRNILKKKLGSKVKAGKSLPNIDLPKIDQEFLNKANQIIKKMYKDPTFLRPQFASEMAVSERQLQRKLKALIDKNPMDLLREYRLSQAAILLKDGYQVSIASDTCGFNSLPYFSKCFKSQYGLSPKAYQKTCK